MRASEFIFENYTTAKAKYISTGANPTDIDTAFNTFKEVIKKYKASISTEEQNIDWWAKYKSFNDLTNFINKKSEQQTATSIKRHTNVGKSIKLDENDTWLIVIPVNHDASCHFGKNTDWCTAKPDQQYFSDYFYKNKIILVYFINKQTNSKWAMSAHTDTDKIELFDENDQTLNINEFKEYLRIDPTIYQTKALVIADKINKERQANKKVDLYTLIQKCIKTGQRNEEVERQLLLRKDIKWTYEYVKDVINGRWPEAEPVIMKNTIYAYMYARDVIKGRWPEAELYIMTNPKWAFWYAKDVIKGRWTAAELYLIQDNYYWNEYSKLVRDYIHKLFA